MEEEIRTEFESSGFTIGGAGPGDAAQILSTRMQAPLLSPLFSPLKFFATFHLLQLVGTDQVADSRGVCFCSADLLHQLQDEPRGSRLQLGGLLPQQVSPYPINRTIL
jgi:hypothetical protein